MLRNFVKERLVLCDELIHFSFLFRHAELATESFLECILYLLLHAKLIYLLALDLAFKLLVMIT